MIEYKVTAVRPYDRGFVVDYVNTADPADTWSHSFPHGALENAAACYGQDDPAAVLDAFLHQPHAHAWVETLPPADDPAVAAGWVTSTGPDSEPITLFTARSTADAAGAHAARIDAYKATTGSVADPDGHLSAVVARGLDGDLVAAHVQDVDTVRWTLIYGGLPEPPLTTGSVATPIPAELEG